MAIGFARNRRRILPNHKPIVSFVFVATVVGLAASDRVDARSGEMRRHEVSRGKVRARSRMATVAALDYLYGLISILATSDLRSDLRQPRDSAPAPRLCASHD